MSAKAQAANNPGAARPLPPRLTAPTGPVREYIEEAAGLRFFSINLQQRGCVIPLNAEGVSAVVVGAGAVRLFVDGEARGDFSAGRAFEIEAGREHKFQALRKNTLLTCARNVGPQIIDQPQTTALTILDANPDIPMRDKVNALEKMMRALPQVEMPPTHYFSPGVYARSITIPKGTVLTGKIHKFAQLNIMSKGDLSVLTEQGIQRVRAPFTIVSPAGTRRIAYAHEETVWTTIHGTDLTDLEQIEAKFIAQSEAEYHEHCKALEIMTDRKAG